MKYSKFTLLLAILISFFSFKLFAVSTENDPETYTYYSDYFVFIADDGGSPLVIPTDFNWSPSKNGYDSEFKSWYGTKNTWPIAYFKEHTDIDDTNIPKEPWEHHNSKSFQFNKNTRKITSKINNSIEVTLKIPQQQDWVEMPTHDTLKKLYGFRSTATIKGKTRNGWMVYERIRWKEDTAKDFGDFKAFYWIPLVINNEFYLFEEHKGKQIAVKWRMDESKKIIVETIPNFKLSIISTSSDSTSKRKNIPKTLQIQAPKWNVDITLKSSGSQVGYGAQFPKGLAYYRQSLLVPEKDSVTKGYGMLELVLEND